MEGRFSLFSSVLGWQKQTVCFHCGIGLEQWIPEDKAFQEHGYWSPYCVYVRYVKGPAFYNECVKYRKDRFPPYLSPNTLDEVDD